MAHVTVVVLVFLAAPILAVKMCTKLDNLQRTEKGKWLPESQIMNLTTEGIMTCSVACLTRRRCQSINFNIKTGECQLNRETNGSSSQQLRNHNDLVFSDISHWPEKLTGACANHLCPLNSFCYRVDVRQHGCNVTFCLSSPAVENGYFDKHPKESPIGTMLPLICDQGYMPLNGATCQVDGTWSSPACASVSSCSMVKQYQPDSEDGEYWLRLTNFDNYTTQIFCYQMSKTSPKSFLSIPNINYGIYPNVMNEACTGDTQLKYDCEGHGGELWFTKIKVDVTTMEVFIEDKTFANTTSNETNLQYGMAFDCYTDHSVDQLKCGTKGRFTIDLSGTGWRVSENQTWEPFGYGSIIEAVDRQRNGTWINLRCGGFSGGCRPTGGLFLSPYPADRQI